MKKLIIFGKPVVVIEKKSKKNLVEFKNGKIVVKSTQPESSLLKDFLADILYSEFYSIYGKIKNEGKVRLFGNFDFEIVEKIDRRKDRIAKFKGNKILVKLSMIALPKNAIKYVLAHELAHISFKRHTKKFWKVVETIYPGYKAGEELLRKARSLLENWSLEK